MHKLLSVFFCCHPSAQREDLLLPSDVLLSPSIKNPPQPKPHQLLTTFFFKNVPKLACQAPKPTKLNKTQEIQVAF